MDIKAVLAKRVDIEGLLIEDLLGSVIKPALDELAKKTDNTLDDALIAMIYPELEKYAVAFVKAKKEELLG